MSYHPQDMPDMERRILDLKMDISRLEGENLSWQYNHDNQWSIYQSRAEEIADTVAFEELFDENVEGMKSLANFHDYGEIVNVVKAVIRKLEGMYTDHE